MIAEKIVIILIAMIGVIDQGRCSIATVPSIAFAPSSTMVPSAMSVNT